jgi:hypothetical protein
MRLAKNLKESATKYQIELQAKCGAYVLIVRHFHAFFDDRKNGS